MRKVEREVTSIEWSAWAGKWRVNYIVDPGGKTQVRTYLLFNAADEMGAYTAFIEHTDYWDKQLAENDTARRAKQGVKHGTENRKGKDNGR